MREAGLRAAAGVAGTGDASPGAGALGGRNAAGVEAEVAAETEAAAAAQAALDDPPIKWLPWQALCRLVVMAVVFCHNGTHIEYIIYAIVSTFIYMRESGVLRKLLKYASRYTEGPGTIGRIYAVWHAMYSEGFTVPQRQGILIDLFSLVYAFFGSLLPSWDPRPVTPIMRQVDRARDPVPEPDAVAEPEPQAQIA